MRDHSILTLVCDIAKHCETIGARNKHKAVFTFYSVTMIELLEARPRIEEDVLRLVLRYVVDSLASACVDYSVASCVVLAQMCSRFFVCLCVC